MVVTARAPTSNASVMQEHTGVESSQTVQAEHEPRPHDARLGGGGLLHAEQTAFDDGRARGRQPRALEEPAARHRARLTVALFVLRLRACHLCDSPSVRESAPRSLRSLRSLRLLLRRGLVELRVLYGDVIFYLCELARPADDRVYVGGADGERNLHAVHLAVVFEDGLFGQARERRLGHSADAQEQPRLRVEVEPLDSLVRYSRDYNISVALPDLLSPGDEHLGV